jgi:hypothetical protein
MSISGHEQRSVHAAELERHRGPDRRAARAMPMTFQAQGYCGSDSRVALA